MDELNQLFKEPQEEEQLVLKDTEYETGSYKILISSPSVRIPEEHYVMVNKLTGVHEARHPELAGIIEYMVQSDRKLANELKALSHVHRAAKKDLVVN